MATKITLFEEDFDLLQGLYISRNDKFFNEISQISKYSYTLEGQPFQEYLIYPQVVKNDTDTVILSFHFTNIFRKFDDSGYIFQDKDPNFFSKKNFVILESKVNTRFKDWFNRKKNLIQLIDGSAVFAFGFTNDDIYTMRVDHDATRGFEYRIYYGDDKYSLVTEADFDMVLGYVIRIFTVNEKSDDRLYKKYFDIDMVNGGLSEKVGLTNANVPIIVAFNELYLGYSNIVNTDLSVANDNSRIDNIIYYIRKSYAVTEQRVPKEYTPTWSPLTSDISEEKSKSIIKYKGYKRDEVEYASEIRKSIFKSVIEGDNRPYVIMMLTKNYFPMYSESVDKIIDSLQNNNVKLVEDELMNFINEIKTTKGYDNNDEAKRRVFRLTEFVKKVPTLL